MQRYLFIDDSGTDQNSPKIVLAGYLVTFEQAYHLSEEWTLARSKFGLEKWFHAVEVEALPLGKQSNWSFERREDCFLEFSSMIRAYMETSLCCVLDRKYWEEFRGLLTGNKQIQNQVSNSFDALYGQIMCALVTKCQVAGIDPTSVHPIFARDDHTSGFMRKIIGRNFQFATAHPRFLLAKDSPGLQAADLCAWYVRKVIDSPESARKKRFQGILLEDHIGVEFGIEQIDELSRSVIRGATAAIQDLLDQG
jgi:hypothetical protein